MRAELKQWRHIFKLDPERTISDEDLSAICQSGTHAIIIGGSSGVTFDNTVELLARIRRFTVPCLLEVSSIEAIVPGFDLYLIPIIMNTNKAQWVTGHHHEAIKAFGAKLPWSILIPEGYIVMNPASTVAQLTEAQTALDMKDVVAYARMAEKMFQLPIVYIEYSGTFGDMIYVKQARHALEGARLFYGGGIDSIEKAAEAAAVAHTIIVGNIIYDNLQLALETVQVIEQAY